MAVEKDAEAKACLEWGDAVGALAVNGFPQGIREKVFAAAVITSATRASAELQPARDHPSLRR